MKRKIRDERVELSKLLIYRDLLFIILFMMLVSIFNDVFIDKLDFSEYSSNILILIAATTFLFIRNLWAGNFIKVSEMMDKKNIILSSFLLSVLIISFAIIFNYKKFGISYSWNYALLIMTLFIIIFILWTVIFYFIYKKETEKNKNLLQDLA